MRVMPFLALITLTAGRVTAQTPAEIDYRLTIDTAEINSLHVEMRLRGSADTFTLAAAAHPEYDDKYWRYLDDLRVTATNGRPARVSRIDSVLWRVAGADGDMVVRYRVRLPITAAPRAAWRAYLTPTGGLVGGPHSFLYVVGAERAQANVTLNLPNGWQVATALRAAGGGYHANDIASLMDSPLFVGQVSRWQFAVKDVPHRVFYWRLPEAAAFDTAAFVATIERFTRETFKLFGSAPYRDYTFIFEDGAYGGLEHANSVTLGLPSAELARNPQANLLESAHEFFHTWNLMRIRPRDYRDLDYRTQPPIAELWFSEGLTLFYADVLARRAGLAVNDSTRIHHLERLLARYYSSPGNLKFSAEQVSRVAYNAGPGALGDYDASTHLQGELIGTMLDLIIRDATHGARSMDDVMRLMFARSANGKRFVSADVQEAVSRVCGCAVKPFFDAHIRSGSAIDVDRYFGLIGLRVRVQTVTAVDSAGAPIPDQRIRVFQRPGEDKLSLWLWHPESVWERAGFHTGDHLLSVNDSSVTTWPHLRSILARLRIGDRVRLAVERGGARFQADVTVSGYDRPLVHIEEVEGATARQRALRAAWLSAK